MDRSHWVRTSPGFDLQAREQLNNHFLYPSVLSCIFSYENGKPGESKTLTSGELSTAWTARKKNPGCWAARLCPFQRWSQHLQWASLIPKIYRVVVCLPGDLHLTSQLSSESTPIQFAGRSHLMIFVLIDSAGNLMRFLKTDNTTASEM